METIKTAVVVILLLGVLYGAYVMLNKPELAPPPEAAWNPEQSGGPDIDVGVPTSGVPNSIAGPPAGVREPKPMPVTAVASSPAGAGDIRQLKNEATLDNPRQPPRVDARAFSPPAMLPQTSTPAEPADAPPLNNVSDLPERSPSPPEAIRAQPSDSRSPPVAGADRPRRAEVTDSKDTETRPVRAFDNAWNSALAQLNKQQWGEALLTLSLFYNNSELTADERQRLVDLLDPLAGKVLYSREHLVLPPHVARAGDSLHDIAQQYQVPVSLLQNINGIANPDALTPGTQVKVVQGPFRGDIDLKKRELVLFAGRYYAGRFQIDVGNDPLPRPADYRVVAKQEGREYRAADGTRIPPGAPENPYGRWWIDLGNEVCLHATAEKVSPRAGLGCLSLTNADAADVYAILALGSTVTIR